MATKLFVGGISFQSSEETLRNAFAQAGTVVSSVIMMDKFTGRSRGFGFVEMGTQEEANAAIEMWNGKELDGRTLVVNEARPMEDRPPRRNFGGGGGFGGGGRGGFGGGRGGDRGGRGGFGGGRGGDRGGRGGRGGFGGGRGGYDDPTGGRDW